MTSKRLDALQAAFDAIARKLRNDPTLTPREREALCAQAAALADAMEVAA